MTPEGKAGTKFWLVWCEAHGTPTYKHTSLSGAKNEAKRLAMLHPGQTFVVLESVGSMRKVEVEWKNHAEASEECPF